MKNIILLIGSILLVSLFVYNFKNTTEETINNDDQIEDIEVAKEENKHPLSLEVLAEQEFDGRDFNVGQVLASNEAYTRYSITYKSGELTISGIMNVPAGDGPFPILILNHGYIDPAVYTSGRGLRREQDYLARQGYVVIHPDYRNHAGSDIDPDAELNFRLGYVEDVINAIKAVQSSDLSYVDRDRIGMLGHSMGGGIAQTIMVTHPELVDAYVLFAPVSADSWDNFNRWTRSREDIYNRIIELYGTADENPDFWRSISPISYLHKVSTPVMLHHGTMDESVPLLWSEKLTEAMENENKEINFYIYQNEPHEFASAWPLVMQRTLDFFNQQLK